ncbi:MAG TPA: HlyD family efflux transporter periplasmic adaptor subunit [Gemmatimonadaceae bacterium]|nr:HlyD family efflux transporter periplasmic adaptor subunit [Gemmatimonadaceae bacterium]
MVDIPRKPVKKRRNYIIGGIALAGVVLVTVALSRMEPAAPEVDRATIWVDTVQRGPMLRQVRGPGTLVPEQMRWVSAVTAGRVEQIHLRPGATVTPTTLLMELSNPDVQLQALDAQRQLTSAEAELVNLRTSLATQRLQQQSALETVRTQYLDAQRNAKLYQTLSEKNLASSMEVQRATEQAEELKNRLEIERERLQVLEAAAGRQIAFQEKNVERLRAIAQFQENRVASMKVMAGSSGVLQELNWEPGQWANPGAVLARIAEPGRLKAVLRIPETQAKDVQVGQPAQIDTRNGIIAGRVMRIDPAVVNGTVSVDVSLEGPLPKGARPDLSVDGTLEIERLDNVLHVGRPAYGQAESTVGLFKLEPDGKTAVRMSVRLGRSSVNEIEIINGLREGDAVILSDLSQYDSQNRIRIK